MSEPPVRIEFTDPQAPSRLARAIRRHLSVQGFRIPVTASRELVGRMFGYEGWLDLLTATGHRDSPADHLVPAEEREARLAQYRLALTSIGVPDDVALGILAAVQPTGGAVPDVLHAPPEHLSSLQATDPMALVGARGGARYLAALMATVADDPHWALRGAHRLRASFDGWLLGALREMQADPDHPRWPGLATLAAAQASQVISGDHPHAARLGAALRAAFAAGDLRAASDAFAAAGEEALLAFVAHVEDILSAQLARLSPNRSRMLPNSVFIPSERAPWKPASPFDLRRPLGQPRAWTTEDIANFGFQPGEGTPELVFARILDRTDGHEWAFLSGPSATPGLPADGPCQRDDVVLLSGGDGRLLCALVARYRADVDAGRFVIEIDGPHAFVAEGEGPPPEALEPYLSCAILGRVDSDLRAWGRIVPPGGRLDVAVASMGSGPSPFAKDLVRTLGERYASIQERLPDLDYDLVAGLLDAGGRPISMPDVHVVVIPEDMAEGWAAYENGFSMLAQAGVPCVVSQFIAGTYAIADSEGNAIEADSREMEDACDAMATDEAIATVRRLLAEAGLGMDAHLIVSVDFNAVVSHASLIERDWAHGRGICLFVEANGTEGARQRLLQRFWAAFPTELGAILDARREVTGRGGAMLPAGATRH